MDVRGLAGALGGDVAGRDTVLAPGPGHSVKDRSLAVRLEPDAPDGFVVFSHAGDDWKACRDHVRKSLGLPDWEPGDGQNRRIPASKVVQWDMAAIDSEVAAGPRPRSEDDLIRIKRARDIWEAADDPRGTLAETYLRQWRAIDLQPRWCGSVLRFHPRCPYRNENTGKVDRVPALIAAFRSVDDDEITAIHRIALLPDGRKRGRLMLGIASRAAVKLSALGRTLSIGEGVETAMAAEQMGLAPAWALGSVGAISFFPVIHGVDCVRVLGEKGEASKEAAKMCGRRWQEAGRKAQVVQPTVGSDLNDELIAARQTA